MVEVGAQFTTFWPVFLSSPVVSLNHVVWAKFDHVILSLICVTIPCVFESDEVCKFVKSCVTVIEAAEFRARRIGNPDGPNLPGVSDIVDGR